MKKGIITFLIAVIFISIPMQKLSAGAAAGGASEPTQIIQMVTDIIDRLLSYIKQVKELEAKMKMIEKMSSNIFESGDKFRDAANEIAGIVGGVDKLMYAASTVATDFANEYKGFDSYVTSIKGHSLDFNATYVHMAKDMRNNINKTLQVLNNNYKYMQNSKNIVNDFLDENQNVEGQTKAIQINTQILAEVQRSINQMINTLMVQTNLESKYRAIEQKKQEIDRAHYEANSDLTEINLTTIPNRMPTYH